MAAPAKTDTMQILDILREAHSAGTHYAVFPIALALMAAQAIYSGVQAANAAKKQKEAQREAEKWLAGLPTYNNPAADEMLNEARTAKNAVTPSLAMYQRQLQQYQANTIGNAQRNATSGAQALSAGAAAQAQVQSQTPVLAKMQDDYEAYNTGNLYKALALKGEDNKAKFNADTDRAQSFINYSLGKAAAAGQQKGQAIGGVISAASGAANYAANSDFSGNKPELPDTPAPTMDNKAQTAYDNMNKPMFTTQPLDTQGAKNMYTAQPTPQIKPLNYGQWYQDSNGVWKQYFGGWVSGQ